MLKNLFYVFLIATFLASCSSPIYMPPPPVYVQETPIIPPKKPPIKLKRETIMIDAGHGGKDHGTQSTSSPKYLEKSVTLSTARLLRGYLNQLGYQAFLTRDKDIFVPLKQRSDLANANGSTLFVSVHFNSAPAKEAQGIEVFYFQSETNPERTQASKQLAEKILGQVIKATQARSRGIKHGNLAVVRETEMPAVLIEGGFMTNPEEMARIKDPTYLKKLAWGIAQGIDKYLAQK